MNISGTLNFFRIIRDPSLCLPHFTVANFNQIPIPLSSAFAKTYSGQKADIRAVVLDKDNCISIPYENQIYKPYREKFQALRTAYPGRRLLIVSNSTGTSSDKDQLESELLERETGVEVLRHNVKKPGCRQAVLEYFLQSPDCNVTSASQIAVIGDRIFTDVMLANLMGSYAFWIRDGVVHDKSIASKFEKGLTKFLYDRGFSAPDPSSPFE